MGALLQVRHYSPATCTAGPRQVLSRQRALIRKTVVGNFVRVARRIILLSQPSVETFKGEVVAA